MLIEIDDTEIDRLTVKFWMDKRGPNFIGPSQLIYVAQVGTNLVEGSAGFGKSPIEALRNLCESIARDEGHRTDNGKLFYVNLQPP